MHILEMFWTERTQLCMAHDIVAWRQRYCIYGIYPATDPLDTGRELDSSDHDEDLVQDTAVESKMSTRPDMILQYSHFLA